MKEIDLQAAKEEAFMKYFSEITREGTVDLLEFLQETGYFTAPASTKHHLYEEGGLLEHSLNVLVTAQNIAPSLGMDGPEYRESIIIAALFHDLGKSSYYGEPMYVENILKSGLRSEAKPYVTNKDQLPIPHEITSVHILTKFIDLTEDEAFAIIYHNGLYTNLGYQLRGNERPLQMLIHFADMWASRVIEK